MKKKKNEDPSKKKIHLRKKPMKCNIELYKKKQDKVQQTSFFKGGVKDVKRKQKRCKVEIRSNPV